MRTAIGLAAVTLAAGLGACGSNGSPRSAGQALFAQDCSVCHTLSGQQSPSRQGGDLLALHVGREAMLQFVREMPVRHRLRRVQLRIVADYVLTAELRARHG
jgi:mono/diheme cytochrome c family protein